MTNSILLKANGVCDVVYDTRFSGYGMRKYGPVSISFFFFKIVRIFITISSCRDLVYCVF